MREIRLNEIRPWCAECRRPVAGFSCSHIQTTGEIEFTAQCHGKREATRLSLHTLETAVVKSGTAFRQAHG